MRVIRRAFELQIDHIPKSRSSKPCMRHALGICEASIGPWDFVSWMGMLLVTLQGLAVSGSHQSSVGFSLYFAVMGFVAQAIP